MDWKEIIQILALATGIPYIVLEILQKRAMWVIGIATGAACAAAFVADKNWGQAGLNIYYMVMSVVGLVSWKRDEEKAGGKVIHLRRLTRRTAVWSAAAFVFGSLAMAFVLRLLGDEVSVLDATATVLSIIGTIWLARSIPDQWMLWIVADILTSVLCLQQGNIWMGVLYMAYIASAVYGYIHWMKHGKDVV